MVRDYELMYIVRPDLDDEALATAMQSVHTLVEGQGGEVVKTTSWGKRRLAYEIERMRDGHYVLLHMRLDSAKVKDVERLLHIHDNVFRHLVTIWVESKGKDGEDEEIPAEPGRERAGRAGSPADAVDDDERPRRARDEEAEPVAVAAGAHLSDEVDDELDLDSIPAAEEDE
jgi:small subunit ribosomal protein S6